MAEDARTTLVDVSPPADTHRYAVAITYVEPHTNLKHEGQFTVEATGFEDAIARGIAVFHEAGTLSGVSWERRIVRVSVEMTD